MDINKEDAMLMELLKEKKTIVDFLDSIFGFLARRTDFYHEMKSGNDTIGFPRGVKEKLVINALKKYDQKLVEETPPVIQEVEVMTEPSCESEISLQDEIECDSTSQFLPKQEYIITNLSNKRERKFDPDEYYNGAVHDNYCWSQTITEIEIHVILPNHITSAKQLCIKVDSENILIIERGNRQWIILAGQLHMKCKNKDTMWSISGGKLQITLEKLKEGWWNRLLQDETPIDVSKIDCSRPFEELPEDSQAVIEKLRWDQHQKNLGLPTSEDRKKEEILRMAWDTEGSPFKGQPFNPSTIKFN